MTLSFSIARLGITALLTASTSAALTGCGSETRARTTRVPVTVAAAERRSMPFALEATGTVEPLETAAVGSQIAGVVHRIAFREGDVVRKGQMLIELDARPLRAVYDQARATLARDRAQAEAARLDAERAEKLVAQDLLARAEYERKMAAADALIATVQAGEAAVRTARLNLDDASIRAPISGRTGRLRVHVGETVRAGESEPLVTINQVRPVYVSFTVPGTAVPTLQRYRRSNPQVVLPPSGPDSVGAEGELVFVDNAVDPASGTILLRGRFANADGRLVPGAFVNVRLVLYTQPNATVVPAPAVTNGQEGAYVYVLNPDSTVTSRRVRVERTVDELAIVSEGLAAGETVVTDGQLRLSPGARVVVRTGPARTP